MIYDYMIRACGMYDHGDCNTDLFASFSAISILDQDLLVCFFECTEFSSALTRCFTEFRNDGLFCFSGLRFVSEDIGLKA